MIQMLSPLRYKERFREYLLQRHRWIKLIVLLEVLFLVYSFAVYVYRINSLETYHFDAIPDMFLKKGYYRYTLCYESDNATGSFAWPHSYVNYFKAIEQAVTSSEDGSITNKNLSTGPAAVMRIDIPEGYRGNIEVRYGGLWYWRLAEFISAACLVFVVILICRDKRKKPS